MKPTTKNAISAILAADETISEDERRIIHNALHGADTYTDRAIRPREVARMLGVSGHTVTAYARGGLIRALPGGKRTRLYSLQSVNDFIAGRCSK